MSTYRGLSAICSGGQIGIDQGALHAAYEVGLVTTGYAPKGWRTERGPMPMLEAFGLMETATPDYSHRTLSNVKLGNGTLVLAVNRNSPGTKSTIQLAIAEGRPLCVIDLNTRALDNAVDEVVDFIRTFGIRTLNVAGNREQSPGSTELHETSRIFMREVFVRLDENNLLIRDSDL
jgi:hypothetical protein